MCQWGANRNTWARIAHVTIAQGSKYAPMAARQSQQGDAGVALITEKWDDALTRYYQTTASNGMTINNTLQTFVSLGDMTNTEEHSLQFVSHFKQQERPQTVAQGETQSAQHLNAVDLEPTDYGRNPANRIYFSKDFFYIKSDA